MSDDLQRLADDVLIDGLKKAIDTALAAGWTGDMVMETIEAVRALSGTSRGTTTYLACEAYLERKTGVKMREDV